MAYPNMEVAKIYKPGESFGEIALILKEKRTATMVCKEDSVLISLSSDAFQNILGDYQHDVLKDKLNFLR